MRNLEDCKAEIFRRSEERMEERTVRRKRIFAWCTPILVLVGLWSVMILPAMLPASSEDMSNMEKEEDLEEIYHSGSDVIDFSSVEIQNAASFPEYYLQITEDEKINEIHTTLLSYFSLKDDISDMGESSESKFENANPKNDEEEKEYTVTFTVETAESVFTLKGNELMHRNTERKVYLSESELTRLKTLLGIQD